MSMTIDVIGARISVGLTVDEETSWVGGMNEKMMETSVKEILQRGNT